MDPALALIEPHYPKAGPEDGRPSMPLETMLRVSFLQQWYALSDPLAEEMLYDSDAMRRFAGIELGDDRVPDETTILNFRQLLETHQLTDKLLSTVNDYHADPGITLRSGALVDVTIINAPPSTKNAAGARDPEISSTKKGNDWYFGSEAEEKRRPMARFRAERACRCGCRERGRAQPRHHHSQGPR